MSNFLSKHSTIYSFSPKTTILYFLILVTTLTTYSYASEVVFIGAFGDKDYTAKLIRSALDHTETGSKITPFVTTPIVSLEKMQSLVSSREDLLRIGFSANVEEINNNPKLSQIHIPVMRGVAGYRVCFSHPDLAEVLEEVNSIESLKVFKFGVGKSWVDKDILTFNGLKTSEVGYYFLVNKQINSLYEMTALKRIDIFCRGINEVFREHKRHAAINQLSLNKTFSLRYEMPFFFYVHKNNRALKERLELGLNIIFENGEFERLWKEEFQESIKFVDMNKRKIIPLKNYGSTIGVDSYKKYLYIPTIEK